MVEGDGDANAVPGLVTRLLAHVGGDAVLRTGPPMRVGDIYSLVNNASEQRFLKLLHVATKRKPGAVLLLLDGDTKAKHPIHTSDGKKSFCAARLGRFLAKRAKDEAGAGVQFSFAVVFARQEFESWLLAGCPDFADQTQGKDLETGPRDASGMISELTNRAYRKPQNQPEYTRKLDFDRLLKRQPKMRSFHRMEHALRELVDAVRNGCHVCTPS